MIQNIRLLLFQMLVLAEYSGDKEEFIARFIRDCQKRLSPALASEDEYYMQFQKEAKKSMNEFVKNFSPTLSEKKAHNLHLLAKSFTSF